MRLYSYEPTALAYDGAPSEANALPEDLKGHRVVIVPGENQLSDKDAALLQADPHANRAREAGILVPLEDEPAAPVAAPAKGGKKTKAAELPADVAKEVADFKALTAEEQEAMAPALSDAAKAALEAEKAAGK